jgi:heat-inducible transcriptional repressor
VKRFNSKELIAIGGGNESWSNTHFEQYFSGDILDGLENGIYFEHFAPTNHMIIKKNCVVGGSYGSLLILGHMSRDFNHFYNSI